MELRRRFIFRGNAAAIGGRIVRPNDLIIESSTASSLTVAGGRSRSRVGESKFGSSIRFREASTSAEGVFDDVKQEVELSYRRVPEDALTTSTRVTAEVLDLFVGDKPPLTIKRLRASQTSKSPAASGEPGITVEDDTAIDGVAIDGHECIVELALPLFQRYNTRSKLLTAADDPEFVRESGDCLFMKANVEGRPSPVLGRLFHGCGTTTYATIVRSIRWADTPYPGAQIDHNMVTVPNFGRIFFGEILITDVSRRLTMLRLELGSPLGGRVAAAEVEDNGTWSN
jgi:hypothetical protein